MNNQGQGSSAGSEMTHPVVQLMEQGLRVMRAENETQQSMAVAHPRNEARVLDKALAELEQYPEFAEKMFYVIPYKDRSDGKEKVVNVEGPSIKAANVLKRLWGNNAAGFRIVGGDEQRLQVQGVFLDYETNSRRTAEMSVSRMAWNKAAGKVIPLRDDRLTMAIQAAGSKAVRNAILNELPIGLVNTFWKKAREVAASGRKTAKGAVMPVAERMTKMFSTFAALGVDKKLMDAYLAEHHELDTDEAVLIHMIGIHNAIDDGQVSVEEVFSGFKRPGKADVVKAAGPVLSLAQREELRKLMDTHKVMVATLREYLQNTYGDDVDSTEKLPAVEFEAVKAWIVKGPNQEIPFGE